MEGKKFDGGKPDLSLIPLKALLGVGQVLTYGLIKYKERNNWQKLAPRRVWAAMFRHLADFQAGEVVDKESGMPHIWHAGANMLFLLWMEATGKVCPDMFEDDTPPPPPPQVVPWGQAHTCICQECSADAYVCGANETWYVVNKTSLRLGPYPSYDVAHEVRGQYMQSPGLKKE